MMAAYYTIQLLPNRFLRWIAARLPYCADAYAPGGFFEPRPTFPPSVPFCGYALAGLGLRGLSLLVLRKQVFVTGVVTMVEHRPVNAEWQHETFRLRPDDPTILNTFSLKLPGPDNPTPHDGDPSAPMTIECEPFMGAHLPAVGQRVSVLAAFVIDLSNGWPELHPVSSWRVA
jgi:hypothetical protein